MTDTSPSKAEKCGFVAVLGLPNAGKSTLINELVGEKVTITSRKAQTTRMQIKGIALHEEENAQIILIDTPGVFNAKKSFDRTMVDAAWAGMEDAELCLLIVDVAKDNCVKLQKPLLERLKQSKKPKWLILNKIDRINKNKLLDITVQLNEIANFDKTFMVSALSGSGVKDLKNDLAKVMPKGAWHYDSDQVTDMSMRMLAAEITREHIYDLLHDELPYSIHVHTEQWENFDDGSVKISQIIYVQRDSQKSLVLGRRGNKIKSIGEKSRLELTEVLERKTHLSLLVKVNEKWMEQTSTLEEYGLTGQ